jgi:hypothetical protein
VPVFGCDVDVTQEFLFHRFPNCVLSPPKMSADSASFKMRADGGLGDADEDGDNDGLVLGDKLLDGLADNDGELEMLGLVDGDTDADGEVLALALRDTDAEGDGDVLALGLCDPDGENDRLGLLLNEALGLADALGLREDDGEML